MTIWTPKSVKATVKAESILLQGLMWIFCVPLLVQCLIIAIYKGSHDQTLFEPCSNDPGNNLSVLTMQAFKRFVQTMFEHSWKYFHS